MLGKFDAANISFISIEQIVISGNPMNMLEGIIEHLHSSQTVIHS